MGGGVADLLPAEGQVWGALYRVTAADLETLDEYEGAPRAYHREVVDVLTQSGEHLPAWAYFVTAKIPELMPTAAYWSVLVDGAREVGLPDEYLSYLRAIPHEPRAVQE